MNAYGVFSTVGFHCSPTLNHFLHPKASPRSKPKIQTPYYDSEDPGDPLTSYWATLALLQKVPASFLHRDLVLLPLLGMLSPAFSPPTGSQQTLHPLQVSA